MLIETDPSAFATGVFLMVFATYVSAGIYHGREMYRDVMERELPSAWRWAALACVFNLIGVKLYETMTERSESLSSFDKMLWGATEKTEDGYVDTSWRKHRFTVVLLGSFILVLFLGFVTIMLIAFVGLRFG